MLFQISVFLLTGFIAFQTASVVAALLRPRRKSAIAGRLGVTIIRPLCGLETHSAVTLQSTFELAYPEYDVIFCVERANDPVLALVRELIKRYPLIPSRILIGSDRISANPKLNNVAKGWRAAHHDWIVLADSNVLLTPDYLQRLFAEWDNDTGLVCSPPLGVAPEGLFAEVECAFLNSHQARWQYAADFFGLGFAQGKSMLWRRDILEAAGGIEALGAELAEDAAATK